MTVTISMYAGNTDAAVALCFDDGTKDQYEHACPLLESRNLPATFFVNAKPVPLETLPASYAPSAAELKDMVERGFEVSNHTYNHTKLTDVSLDSARLEIVKNDDVIESYTGVRPVTFAFPHNARNKELIALAQNGRVGVRTYEEGFGQTYRSSTYNDMRKWIDKAIAKKEFAVGMFHGIESGYDYWTRPEELMQFLDYLTMNSEKLWVGTFRDISAYLKERDYTRLKIEQVENGILITAETNLDTSLFSYPLTLVVNRNKAEEYITISPNGSVLLTE